MEAIIDFPWASGSLFGLGKSLGLQEIPWSSEMVNPIHPSSRQCEYSADSVTRVLELNRSEIVLHSVSYTQCEFGQNTLHASLYSSGSQLYDGLGHVWRGQWEEVSASCLWL